MNGPSASELAQVAADRAATVDGVVALDAGPLVTRATYGVNGRVEGVTVRSRQEPVVVTVHVAVAFGTRIPELAERLSSEVRAAVLGTWPDLGPVEVGVEVTDVVPDEGRRLVSPRRELQ